MGLPLEAIAFALTDIVGSTRLWESAPASMAIALRRHDEIVSRAVGRHGGELVKTKGEGDSTFSVFVDPGAALAYALDLQLALAAEPWPVGTPVGVRCAVHVGPAEQRDGDYYGRTVNRCARLRAAAHGGQVLLSGQAAALAAGSLPPGSGLLDLGERRLKDLAEPEHVFQLTHPELRHDFPPLEAADAVENNLPADPHTLLGRTRELGQAHALLDTSRLLTITGPGGCGKTTLALQLALEHTGHHPDGVWLIELDGVVQPELVATVASGVLGVREELGQTPTHTLTHELGARNVLLVLDGCERVVDGVADLCANILRSCPHTTLIVTSREVLNVRGEVALPLLGLPVPAVDDSDAAVRESPAVQLFVSCARRAAPIEPDTSDLVRIGEICRVLDGVPLAIELAAARCRTLTVAEIADRLDDRFALLAGGSRDVPEHHRTLRGLVDWSHQSLTSSQQRLFRMVTAFAGSFSLPAAEAIARATAPPDLDVLEELDQLAAKSMIVPGPSASGVRYRVLSTMREYGRERRLAAGDDEVVMRAIVDHFVQAAHEAYPHLLGPEQAQWLDRLEVDHDNLRLALHHALVERPRAAGAELASKLWRFWYARGHFNEGRHWVGLTEALDVDDVLRGDTLHAAGTLAWAQGDYGAAEDLLLGALRLRRGFGSDHVLAETLNNLGTVAIYAGHYDEADQHLFESLRFAQRCGHEHSAARSWTNLAYAARLRGDFVQARRHLDVARHLMEDLGDDLSTIIIDANVAAIEREAGDLETAHGLLVASLGTAERLRAAAHIPVVLTGLAAVQRDRGQDEDARRMAQHATSIAREHRATRTLCEALIELGLAQVACGDRSAGVRSLDEALATASSAGDLHATARAHAASAQLAVAEEQWERCLHHARIALGIREELREGSGITECTRLIESARDGLGRTPVPGNSVAASEGSESRFPS